MSTTTTNKKGRYGSGSLARRGDSWLIRWYAGGRQHSRSLSCATYTEKQAWKELNRLALETENASVANGKVTIKEILLRWYHEYAEVSVAESTLERYRQIVHQHLIPKIGHLDANKVTSEEIEGYLRWARSSGRLSGKGGLAVNTVLHTYRLISQAFDWAMRRKLVRENPAREATVPKAHDPTDDEPSDSMQVLTEDELRRLLKAAAGSRWYMPILLAANTGMRQGEILALKWECVDLEAGTIAVRQSLRRGRLRKQLKTKYSRRTIEIDPGTIAALRAHREAQELRKLAACGLYDDQGYVCAREYGTPLYGSNLTVAFQKLLKKAGLPRLRFHDLRHTHASILIRAGEDILAISRRLGHSRPSVTLDVYGHLIPVGRATTRKWCEAVGRYMAEVGCADSGHQSVEADIAAAQ